MFPDKSGTDLFSLVMFYKAAQSHPYHYVVPHTSSRYEVFGKRSGSPCNQNTGFVMTFGSTLMDRFADFELAVQDRFALA
jgi:hypothetical protein